MAGKKISVKFDVQEDLVKMLEYAAEKYKLGISLKPCDACSNLLLLMAVGIRKNTKLKKVNDVIYLSSLKEVRLQL